MKTQGRLNRATRLFLALAILGGMACGVAGTQAAAQTQAPPQSRPTSTPYTGDFAIFEHQDRDQKLQPNRIMDLLGIQQGKTVADIGAGSGWFTVRAAARVGLTGKVYAEDINPAAIDYIQRRASRENLGNIHTVLGTVDDPRLPEASVDALLILKTYHEFARPVPLMMKLHKSLRTGAKVGIIDRNGDGTNHGIMPAVVEREMAEAGFRRQAKYDFTKADGEDYFLIFLAK